jgi:hypothetical protein
LKTQVYFCHENPSHTSLSLLIESQQPKQVFARLTYGILDNRLMAILTFFGMLQAYAHRHRIHIRILAFKALILHEKLRKAHILAGIWKKAIESPSIQQFWCYIV